MVRQAQRRTPIERYIEDGPALDRRRKYDEQQVQQGIIRVTVRCYADDAEAIKNLAASLLAMKLAKKQAPRD